ncbi:MAG TPA: ABC transporter ATP-binding protein [Ideonella sp.]|nr:ABC transporter ATP-binding protein [Ideonella sp.]
MSAPTLELRGLRKRFGALAVTQDVHLQLQRGARHALIGPNGAGKSTLVNLVTGVLSPDAGQVLVGGRDVTRMAPDQRVKQGLVRTFQINSLFMPLTVAENIALALAARTGIDTRLGRPMASRSALVDEAAAQLQALGLLELAQRPVQALAYGQRRQVEIALALALRPSVLLLDEPAAGVPSTDARRLFDLLERLPDDVAVLVIEHDMELVFRFAQRITVLVEGAVLLEGPTAEVRSDPRVRDVYLGRREHA